MHLSWAVNSYARAFICIFNNGSLLFNANPKKQRFWKFQAFSQTDREMTLHWLELLCRIGLDPGLWVLFGESAPSLCKRRLCSGVLYHAKRIRPHRRGDLHCFLVSVRCLMFIMETNRGSQRLIGFSYRAG